MVGRAAEQAQLRAALRERERDAFLVAGPAGTGKTRLVTETSEAMAAAGWTTLQVTGSPVVAQLPLAAFAPLLPPGVLAGTSELAVLLSHAHTEIAARARTAGLLLVVDDAHALDEASALLVYQLVATGAAFVLATVRTGESVPDPITGLWKDGLATRIDLEPLTPADVHALAQAVLGGPAADATVDLLADRSAGNALLLRELITGARDAGVLVQSGGLWQLAGELPTTPRLAELVEGNLGGLAPVERDLVELLAVGEPIGVAELIAAGNDAAVERLERRGLVSVSADGLRLTARLGHPVYGDVLRAGLPERRRRALATRLADLVTATGARRHDDVLRIATWRLAAGQFDDPDLFWAGARAAHHRHDYPLTNRLAAAAVRAGAGPEARLLVARTAAILGDADAAERELDQIDVTAAEAQLAFTARVIRMEILLYTRSQIPEALGVIAEGLADPRPCPARDELEFYSHQLTFLMGDPTAEDRVGEVSQRASGDFRAVMLGTRAMNHIALGRYESALRLCEVSGEMLRAVTEPMQWTATGLATFESGALAELGRLADALAVAESAYGTALATRQPDGQAWMGACAARALHLQGRITDARRWAEQAAGSTAAQGRTYFAARAHVELALVAAAAGDEPAARAAVKQARDTGMGGPGFEAQVAEAEGWAEAAAGDLPAAAQRFADAAALARPAGLAGQELSALHARRRVGAAVDRQRVRELAELVEGPLAAARIAYLQATTGAELLAASAAFDGLGARLFAAEAAADAAVVLAKDEPRAAAGATRRAQELAEACVGGRTPALRPVAVRQLLTAAERRVADLAAEGLRSKDIAARLTLSPRTVDNTLQRVYAKLGITNRTDLPDALQR